jgi:hypothetical protein
MPFLGLGHTLPLERHLLSDSCAVYDEKLLPGFYEVVEKIMDSDAYDRHFAYLMSWHPTSPDPYPALNSIKNDVRERQTWKRGHNAVDHLGCVLLRVMFILDLQGNSSEAQWALDVLQDKFGRVWKARDRILASFKRDPKLKHLLRKKSSTNSTHPTEDVATELQEARALAKRQRLLDDSLKS